MKLNPARLILVAFLGANSWAHAADLLETFLTAQANDPVFASAKAARQAGLEKLPQGRSLLLPTINLTANSIYNYQDSTLSGATFSNEFNSNGYGVNLVQPLFRQQNWTIYTEAELQLMQTEAQFMTAVQDLVLRVSQAYFDVLIAQDTVELAAAQKTAISEQLEQAKRNFEVGSATITDTLEAQSRYDLTSAQQIAVQNDLENKRRALQQLINEMPQGLKPLGKDFKLEAPQPADMEKWVEDALLSNPQLADAKAAAELAEKEVARNRGGH
jgi:outer membrane protein